MGDRILVRLGELEVEVERELVDHEDDDVDLRDDFEHVLDRAVATAKDLGYLDDTDDERGVR